MSGAGCPHCGAELPGGFPGATVTCVCGERTTWPSLAPTSRESSGSIPAITPAAPGGSGGPYRAGGPSAPSSDLADIACPYCGNPCPPLVRVCPHCDVRLDNVRCAGCFTLQPPGSFTCGRCGRPLELEPLLDATDAPCPRCRRPLEAAAGAGSGVHECPRCGGMFVGRAALAEILSRAEQGGSIPDARPTRVTPLDQVTYLPCPLCHASMNRVNFGRVSGVIVDVCRSHGTWFDGGELTRVITFAASGGLSRTRARERDLERAEEARRAAAVVSGEHSLLEPPSSFDDTVRAWRDFLDGLF